MKMGRIRWANVGLAVGVTLLMGAVLLGIGEWLVRHRERTRTTVPGTMPLMYYEAWRTRYALVRDYDYFGWVHINSDGFRGEEIDPVKADNTVRILAVGGSTTFDSYATGDDRTWPARLEYWLNQGNPARPIQVINAGVPGYTVLDNVVRLQTSLYTWNADLIIVYHGHNDLFAGLRTGLRGPPAASEVSQRPGAVPVTTPWTRWLEQHSLLYTKIAGRLNVLRFLRSGSQERERSGDDPAAHERAFEQATSRFERDLTAFVALTQCLGIPVVIPGVVSATVADTSASPDSLLTWMWTHTVPFASKELVWEGYRRLRGRARQVADRFGATYIDTEPFDVHRVSLYAYGDPVHFNDEGSDLMARSMAEAILAAGVLERIDDPPICGSGRGTVPAQVSDGGR